jgi:DNA polymerase II small subunit
MEPQTAKTKLVKTLLDRGILVNESILERIEKDGAEQVLLELEQGRLNINSSNSIGKPKLIKEKEESCEEKLNQNTPDNVKIIFSYVDNPQKKTMKDFVNYFNKRFEVLRKMLMNRPELVNLLSINKLLNKREKDNASIIGLVTEKSITRAKNIMLKIEDTTGQISVVVNQTKKELYELAKNLVEDEVVAISGFNDDKIIFCNKILQPDVTYKELKKAPTEDYAIFLSDIHVGSVDFLEEKFLKFIQWLRQEIGSETQKALVRKIKYLFIAGDLVDGVGIYPGQDEELEIKDIYDQYNKFSEYIKMIPKDISVIICPGNHDAVRLAEPQPIIDCEYIQPLLDLPNVVFVSNPGIVNIAAEDGFSGFDVLLYHGYSFDHYISNVDYIRNNGGYDRADLVMKFLLQRRHLAPTHTSTLYIPDSRSDPLVISALPDFFATGHVHKTSIANYRNITLISGSCWQRTTSFQEKVGHKPEPARVPIVNLQTREAKILRF